MRSEATSIRAENLGAARRPLARFAAALCVTLVCLAGLAVASASAAFEQVDTFAGTPGVLQVGKESTTAAEETAAWPEDVQLGSVGAMAVNYTGAGGVPAGTIYAAVRRHYFGGKVEYSVVRFNPDGSFSEAWSYEGTVGAAPNARCGPQGSATEPHCVPNSGLLGAPTQQDVDIDQTTGDVYVYNQFARSSNEEAIHVYTPDGSQLIAEFGEFAPVRVSTASTLAQVHDSSSDHGGAIAVNSSGDVYLYDENSNERYQRLMVFEPQSPGDYEHYVYAGQSHDLAAGTRAVGALLPQHPAVDAAGDVYVAGESGRIAKLDPDNPAAPPLCEFSYPPARFGALAVNPLGGEVFFSSSAASSVGKIHELGAACDGEGKFSEVAQFSVSPTREFLTGLAFDPLRTYGPGRPAGVLLAGSPNGNGGAEEGEYPNLKRESSLGYLFAPPQEIPPEVRAQSFGHVTATSALLGAEVNPKSSTTSFAFQYETEAAYEANPPGERFTGAAESPGGGGEAGSGPSFAAVSAALAGLQPATTYRFRVVATSHCSQPHPQQLCEAAEAPGAFRTYAIEAPGLADRRAYELVSPAQKHGGQVTPAGAEGSCGQACKPGRGNLHFPMQSAPDGEAVAYEGTAFDAEASGLADNLYLARRDPQTGWQSANPTPSQLARNGQTGYQAIDPSLGRAVLIGKSFPFTADAPAGYEDLYSQPTGNPLGLVSLLHEAPHNRSAETFEVRYAGASEDGSRVFFAANDALTGATLFAPAPADPGATKLNLYEWQPATGAVALVNVKPGNTEAPVGSFAPPAAHAISTDGRRAFWTDEAGHTYVREDGQATKAISGGSFLAAAADGSRVMTDDGSLYDLETETATDLTGGQGGFVGLLGQSEDLTHLYFADTKVLTGAEENCREGLTEEVCEAAAEGAFNLYAYAQGQGTRFVARLLASDGTGAFHGDWEANPAKRTAEASPGGRYLAFLSTRSLTGAGVSQQAYLYDSATGKLRCASCNPSGARPLGLSRLPLIEGGSYQPRYLTDSGRLYFDTQDSLVPADTNHGVEDTYQLEPPGAAAGDTCQDPGGCLTLISAGTGGVDSNFVAADPGGKNVFFTTRDQLSLRDSDDLFDLYDAREEGGLAIETETRRGECQGEACQAQAVVPNHPTPATSVPAGEGNVGPKAKHHRKKHRHRKHRHHRRAGQKGRAHR